MVDISGSRFIVRPIERHEFVEAADRFTCKVCERPRALHQFDGFIPTNKTSISMDPRVRFGRHPHWFRPGTIILNKAEQAMIDRLYSKKKKGGVT